MYSEFFEQLGAAGGGGGGNSSRRNAGESGTSSASSEPTPLLSFKAGKMELKALQTPPTTTNISYQCVPSLIRGEVRLVWKNQQLQWEWYDRRAKKIVESFPVISVSENLSSEMELQHEQQDRLEELVRTGNTFERVVMNPNNKSSSNNADRIYVWTRLTTTDAAAAATTTTAHPNHSSTDSEEDDTPPPPLVAATATSNNTATILSPTSSPPSVRKEYHMYWMQGNTEEEKNAEDELIVKINAYLADPASAAPSTAGGGEEDQIATPTTEGSRRVGINRGVNTSTNNNNSSSSSNPDGQSPVDALSNILQNLGMPQTGVSTSTSSTASDQGTTGKMTTTGTSITNANNAPMNTSSTGAGTITLADLQGAMASLQQQQQAITPTMGPALTDVINNEAIQAILADETASNRLVEFLPPEQRSREYLEANLRSPQLQQTLRTLTATLVAPANGGGEDDANAMNDLLNRGGTSDWSGLYSVLANFQLDPQDATTAMTTGNPIQAFLDCIIQSVEREQATAAGGVNANSSTNTGPTDSHMDDNNDTEMTDENNDNNDNTNGNPQQE